MGRIRAWFGSLTTGMKAVLIAAFALLGVMMFAILSPLIMLFSAFFVLVCIAAVAYRMLRGRSFRIPGILLLSSLVVLLVSSGVSGALYRTSTEQASSPSNSQTEPKQERPREETKGTTPETTIEAAKPSPEKSGEQAAEKPKSKPKPEPKPKSKPKPKPKTKPAPANNKNSSPYDKTVTVSRVIDGDTIEISPVINGVEDVRLIGVDTPETVDPGEEVEPYGPEASAFATEELAGREVDLEFDEEKIDQYDRVLAYVYTGTSMFNEELVEKGYAQAYPYPPNTKYEMRFENAQREARASDLGIWGLSLEQQCQLADRGNSIGEGSMKCELMAEESASPSASPSASASAGSSATVQPSGGGAVAPISEDDCPQNAPIKGNQSGLYHVPGGAYYDVTNPEECFATAADAEAAGYEASSR